VLKLLTVLFSFSGRATRKQFWLTQLVFSVVFTLTFGLTLLSSDFAPQLLVLLVVWLPGAITVYFVTIRRLHDRDRGAVWFFLFFILPGIVFAPFDFLVTDSAVGNISQSFYDTTIYVLIVLGNIPVWWGYIEIGFLRGTRGPNRFGPDPLMPEQTPELPIQGSIAPSAG
jgi:uncharacterized membrane protein YhaH (DUF805 family)